MPALAVKKRANGTIYGWEMVVGAVAPSRKIDTLTLTKKQRGLTGLEVNLKELSAVARSPRLGLDVFAGNCRP